MKNSIVFILLLFTIIVIGGCNNKVDNPLPPCDPDVISQNTESYFNQTGTLALIDTVPNYIVPVPIYIINAEDVSYIPLEPCNLPVSEFNIAIGDTINILFSGNLMLLSPTASSAGSLQFELTSIQKLNNNE